MREIDEKVLAFIRQKFRDESFTPTHGEISEEFRVSRGRGTDQIFKNLIEAGAIIFAPDGGRRYLPTDWREIAAGRQTDENAALRARVAELEAAADSLKKRKQADVKRQIDYRNRKKVAEGKREKV